MPIASSLLNRVYYEDCIEGLGRAEFQGQIALIFADPPYNVSGKAMTNVFEHGSWAKIDALWDCMSATDYEQFTANWLAAASGALQEGGTLVVSASYHNAFLIGYLAQKNGFEIRGDVIWFKRTAVPNVTRRTYRHSTEILMWFTKKGRGKYTFNYDVSKLFTSDNKQLRNMWDILKVGQKESTGHPAQKPEELLFRVIAIHSRAGDVVCDPFAGSGTTLKVAKLLGRFFIGFETNQAEFGPIIEHRLGDARFTLERVQEFFEKYESELKN